MLILISKIRTSYGRGVNNCHIIYTIDINNYSMYVYMYIAD